MGQVTNVWLSFYLVLLLIDSKTEYCACWWSVDARGQGMQSGIAALTQYFSLRWRHNGHDSVSNHQPHGHLLNRLFRWRSKKTSKLRVTGLCEGNSPGAGEFPAQMAGNAQNVSIWWRHHVVSKQWQFKQVTINFDYVWNNSKSTVESWYNFWSIIPQYCMQQCNHKSKTLNSQKILLDETLNSQKTLHISTVMECF